MIDRWCVVNDFCCKHSVQIFVVVNNVVLIEIGDF